jgi:hypothetical protein
MIKIVVGNNLKRETIIKDENTTTLRQALEEASVDYTQGQTSLDGATLQPGDMDKTFADFGVGEKCFLLNVAKATNA